MSHERHRITQRLTAAQDRNATLLEQARGSTSACLPDVIALIRQQEDTAIELQQEIAWLQEMVETPAANPLETVMHIPLSFAAQWLPRAGLLTVFGHPMMSLNRQELLAFAAAAVYDTQILKQQVAELQLAVGAKPRIILPH